MKCKQFDWTLLDAIEVRLGSNTYGRQRTIFEDDHLLAILHTDRKFDFSAENIKGSELNGT